MDDALNVLGSILPNMVPTMVALALSSMVILTSHTFSGEKKVYFQVAIFSVALAACVSYFTRNPAELQVFADVFFGLSAEARFCLSVLTIVTVYLGSAMYIAAPESEGAPSDSISLATPASCDTSVDFYVPDVLPETDKVLFEEFFDRLRAEIVEDLPTVYELSGEATAWVDRMMTFTVAGGKMNRGLALMSVQETLAKDKGLKLTNKERCQSAALGWCIEFLQAFFLVADDVMDDSVTRRGQPCWFRLPEVKLVAINDSFILESCVYKILKKYFGREKFYPQLVDLMIETTRQTELGQLLDLTSQVQGAPIDLNRFTIDRYLAIVKYKTAFYSFYLPVALGMIVAGVTDAREYDKAREILCIMGTYFQIQDDYLDCYGSPEVIGKIGTDIQDNKCSWLVVQALDLVNPKQRKVLEENYGQHDAKKVAKVKKLFVELELEARFNDYEEQSYKEIQALLSTVKSMPTEIFEFLLRKIYKRSK
jgi:farnesyl diphosphate synthase